jgi:hypothetical protein
VGNAELLLETARVWVPAWSRTPVLSRGDRIALLRDAATSASDPAVRAQLLARVATEFLYSREQSQALALVDEAVSSARRSGDPTVLTEALLRHYQIAFTAQTLEERRANMDEVLRMTLQRNDVVAQFFALIFGAGAAVEAVDLAQADMFLAGALDLVDRLRLPVLDAPAFGSRAWRAGLRGDLDEAEELAKRASESSMRHGVAFPMLAVTMQIGCIRWHQERLNELLPVFNDPPEWMHLTETMRALLISRALISSPATRADARPVFERVAAERFADLPHDDMWSTSLVLAGEIAAALGDANAGRAVLEMLAPLSDRVASLGFWIVAPLAYGAALGAQACGDPAQDDLFEQAIEISTRLEAPILRARAEMAWAHSLAARETRTARDRSRKLLDAAGDVLHERGCARAVRLSGPKNDP